MPENPNETPTAVVATRHIVQIPTRLAGLLLALFILVPVGSAFLAGRGSSVRPQVVVYQLPATPTVGGVQGRVYPATGDTALLLPDDVPLMSYPAASPGSTAATAPQLGIQPGPIDELRKLIESLKPENLVPTIIKVIAQSVTGIDPDTNKPAEGRPDIASQIGGWVLQTPNFASPAYGGTAAIREFIDALRAAGWALLLVTGAAAAIRFKLGLDPQPSSTVVRLLVCALFLGFYHELFAWAVSASNQITSGIFDIKQTGWGGLGRFTIAGFMPLQSILMLVAFFVLLVVGFVRVLSLVLFLVVYIIGPIVVPLRMIPEWDFFSQWYQTGLRALVWPVLWAVEAKLILVLTDNAWAGGIAGLLFAPLAQIALLYAMYKTPSWVSVAGSAANPRIVRSVQQIQYVGKVVHTTAAAYSTGGVSAALKAALTGLDTRKAASIPRTTGRP
ncbi:MAG: hypothetical protein M3Q29_02405 [Chloroflexota bacterium]|nr:hypothetical protein [Chloroflexota bacterium]